MENQEVKNGTNKLWFKRKLYGWGWTPVTWQGWALTLGYIVTLLILSMTIDKTAPDREIFFTFFLPLLFITGVFLGITYKKGAKPRWQWGVDKGDL